MSTRLIRISARRSDRPVALTPALVDRALLVAAGLGTVWGLWLLWQCATWGL